VCAESKVKRARSIPPFLATASEIGALIPPNNPNFDNSSVGTENQSPHHLAFGITGYDSLNWKPTSARLGNDYILSFVAIPEPGGALSLLGGGTVLNGWQRSLRRNWRLGNP
jgi:hypothetical protein